MGLCSGLLVENVGQIGQHDTKARRQLCAIPANPHAGLTAQSDNMTTYLNRMVPEGQEVPQGQKKWRVMRLLQTLQKVHPCYTYIHVHKFGGCDGDVFESECSSL